MGHNPIARFNQLLARAENKGMTLPNAVALATVSKTGKPSVRMMLLKGADSRGFRFFTNLQSRKAGELKNNTRAALCFWWPKLGHQVRVEGRVKPVSEKEADAYFASRPRGNQIGAWASAQSKTLISRKALLQTAAAFEKLFKRKKIPRPPFWSGFVLIPEQIEFWTNQADRLHTRVLFARKGRRWKQTLLYP